MKAQRLQILFFIALIFLSSEVSHAQIWSLLHQVGLKALLQSQKIKSIEIQDEWMGISSVGRQSKTYLLKPDAQGAFSGVAHFDLGGGKLLHGKEDSVQVPKEAIEKFLSELAQSSLVDGKYKANLEHSDDYPSTKIKIELENTSLLFYSESQGDLAIPWGFSFQGKDYTINDKHPGTAFHALVPFLKFDAFNRFVEETSRSVQKNGR